MAAVRYVCVQEFHIWQPNLTEINEMATTSSHRIMWWWYVKIMCQHHDQVESTHRPKLKQTLRTLMGISEENILAVAL